MDTDSKLIAKAQILAKYKKDKDIAEHNLKLVKEAYQQAASEVLLMLEKMDLDSFKAHGYNFYTKEKESVSLPATPEDREIFFNYLREKGIFDESITVHSSTLNSLYNSWAKEALEKGILEFNIPGIKPATSFKTLELRAIKEKKK